MKDVNVGDMFINDLVPACYYIILRIDTKLNRYHYYYYSSAIKGYNSYSNAVELFSAYRSFKAKPHLNQKELE